MKYLRYIIVLPLLSFLLAGCEEGELETVCLDLDANPNAKVTVNLATLEVTCPGGEPCLYVYDDKEYMISHGNLVDVSTDSCYLCIDCNGDDIFDCPIPPPPPGEGGDGGSMAGNLGGLFRNRPKIRASVSLSELENNVVLFYTCDDIAFNRTQTKNNLSHRFVSLTALKRDFATVQTHYAKGVIPGGPTAESFMYSNAARINISVINAPTLDYVLRVSYRDFDKLDLLEFIEPSANTSL